MRNHNAAFSGPTANAILEALRVGLLLVDAKGRLVAANGVGVDYLSAGEGLCEDDEGRIVAEMPSERAKLSRDIHAAVTGHHRAVVLRRSAQPTSLAVTVTPFQDPDDEQVRAMLVIHDPDRKVEEMIAEVRSMFRLSPAEADIAVQLAMGADLDEIARKRGVSLHTLRAQLASAMGKAGVRRQAELVGAVLRPRTI